MKRLILLFLLVSVTLYSQSENQFSVELKGNLYQPMGNNYLADGVQPFYGFGFGISGTFVKNFALGLEIGKGYSEVKDISVFGALKSPQLTIIDLFAVYHYSFNEKTAVEGNLGMSGMTLKSLSDYRKNGYTESGGNVFFGAKLIQSITKDNKLNLVGGTRVYFFRNQVEMTNKQWQDYYSKSTLLNFNIGLRLNF